MPQHRRGLDDDDKFANPGARTSVTASLWKRGREAFRIKTGNPLRQHERVELELEVDIRVE